MMFYDGCHHQSVPTLEGSTDCLVPVRAIDLCVHRAVVVSEGVYPVIGLGQTGGGVGLALGLVPHEGLKLSELIPQVRVGGGNGLSDARVEVGHPGLRCGAEISISLEGA